MFILVLVGLDAALLHVGEQLVGDLRQNLLRQHRELLVRVPVNIWGSDEYRSRPDQKSNSKRFAEQAQG
jgi:hypothetical protein